MASKTTKTKKQPAKKASKAVAKDRWFVKKRGSYMANSWEGLFLYTVYLAFLVLSLVYNARQITDWVAILLATTIEWLLAAIAITWVAQQKS